MVGNGKRGRLGWRVVPGPMPIGVSVNWTFSDCSMEVLVDIVLPRDVTKLARKVVTPLSEYIRSTELRDSDLDLVMTLGYKLERFRFLELCFFFTGGIRISIFRFLVVRFVTAALFREE